MSAPPVRIYNPFATLLAPMPGDKTAMGTIPAAGFQYCEALTTASGFGHLVFPPEDRTVRWIGSGFEVLEEGVWRALDAVPLSPARQDEWRQKAPAAHQGRLPPFLQRFFVPDTLQVFSGLFVESDPGWSVLVRPIVNTIPNPSLLLYEAVVETDIFAPCPLFVNVRFLSRNAVVRFEKFQPLFQVQPVAQAAYTTPTIAVSTIDETSPFNWDGLADTTRIFDPSAEVLELGSYKKRVRARRRQR